MKKLICFLTLLLAFASAAVAQQGAVVTGLNSDTDNFSFVLLENFPDGASLYVSTADYDSANNAFSSNNLFEWNPPVGGAVAGTVVLVEPAGGSTFNASTGTFAARGSGGLDFGTRARAYLFAADDDADPANSFSTVFSFIYTQAPTPPGTDPSLDPDCFCTPTEMGNINFQAGGNDGMEYSSDRTAAVGIAELNDRVTNWTTSTGIIALSTAPFTNLTTNVVYASIDRPSVTEDDPAMTIDVLANDPAPAMGSNMITAITQPPNGTVAITNGGADLTYQPNPDYCNDGVTQDRFSYTLNSGAVGGVYVSVACTDDPITLVDDAFSFEEDTIDNSLDVLGNDLNPDNDPLTITAVTQPPNGTVTITGGGTDVSYLPNLNFCNATFRGGETFTYTVNGTLTANVTITVDCELLFQSDWIVTGPANVFDAANWTGNIVPDMDRRTFVRNGGIAVADGTVPGNPTAWNVERLAIGTEQGQGTLMANNVDITVSGALEFGETAASQITGNLVFTGIFGAATITDANLLMTGVDMDIGAVSAGGSAVLEASGNVTIERVTNVNIGEDIDIGAAFAEGNGSTTSTGMLTMRDISTLDIQQDIRAATGEVSNAAEGGLATINSDGTLLLERINTVNIANGLRIAEASAGPNAAEQASANVTLRDITQLTTGQIEINNVGTISGEGADAGVSQHQSTTTFERTNVQFNGNGAPIFLIHTAEQLDDAVHMGNATVSMIDTTVTFPTPMRGVGGTGQLNWVVVSSDEGLSTNEYIADITMNGSSIVGQPNMQLGVRVATTPGIISADVRLEQASYIDLESATMGADSSLTFAIEGLTRVTSATVGAANTYSAIDLVDGNIASTINAEFTFVPPAGTHSFDLIRSDDPAGLDAFTATLNTNAPNVGFVVDSFGVVDDGGVDVLRLTVTNFPNNAPVIQGEPLSASVDESAGMGAPVITVSANDADPGAAGNVSYAITGGNTGNVFGINSMTGAVTVVGSLDAETLDNYMLDVSATDQGVPVMNDTSTISITVNDVNEFTPVITGGQSFMVANGAAATTLVGTPAATDADVSADVFQDWMITGGNVNVDLDADPAFAIDPATGQITVNDADDINLSQQPVFNLSITVSDGQLTSAAETVVVNVTGVDMSIDVDNSRGGLRDGELVDYLVTITNEGNISATNAQALVTLPSQLTGVSWICEPQTANDLCGATNGTGNIDEQIQVDPTGAVTFTVTGTVSGMIGETVTVDGQINAPSGEVDNNQVNNVATDADVIVGEEIFSDGFEAGVIRFKAGDGKALFIDPVKITGPSPTLIGVGEDRSGKVVRLVHARRAGGQIQYRVSEQAAPDYWQPGIWITLQ